MSLRSAGVCAAALGVLLLGANPAAAQRTETLLGGEIESGGFGGPMVQVFSHENDAAVFVGGRGGWIINHTLSIGGGGWGLITDLPSAVPDSAPAGTRLNLGYGGVIVEYTVRPHDLIHYSISLLSGWGTAGYSSDDSSGPDPDAFFVLEPAVHVELNVTEFMRVTAGGSYRYPSGIDLAQFDDEDLEQIAAVFSVKFGSF